MANGECKLTVHCGRSVVLWGLLTTTTTPAPSSRTAHGRRVRSVGAHSTPHRARTRLIGCAEQFRLYVSGIVVQYHHILVACRTATHVHVVRYHHSHTGQGARARSREESSTARATARRYVRGSRTRDWRRGSSARAVMRSAFTTMHTPPPPSRHRPCDRAQMVFIV